MDPPLLMEIQLKASIQRHERTTEMKIRTKTLRSEDVKKPGVYDIEPNEFIGCCENASNLL